MKYMVAELLFTVRKAWHEEDKICLLMTDNKEIRFPVEKNRKLLNSKEIILKLFVVEPACTGPTSTKTSR